MTRFASASHLFVVMDFEPNSEFDDQRFAGLDLENGRIQTIEFYDCHFVDCNFREAEIAECKFHDCTFQRCDLSLVNWADSSFQGCNFQDSKLIGVDWTFVAWNKFIKEAPVRFEACVLDYGTFMGLELLRLTAVSCSIKDVDFSGANLTEANFKGSTFTKSQFRNTTLTKANFQQAKEYTIDIRSNDVSKAKFSMPEAVALLHSLDIVLED